MINDPHAEYVPVVCSLCRTRMYARPEQIGQQLTCPDCGTHSPVLAPRPAAAAIERADPGEYDLREPREFGDPTAIAVNTPAEPAVPAARQPPVAVAVVLVTCPLCHTRLHPPRADCGKQITCPDCGTQMVVPAPKSARRQSTPDLVAGQYDMRRAPVAALPQVAMLLSAQAVPTGAPPDEPPRWTMFSGVFSFPWQPEARLRWLYMTMGYWVAGGVALFSTGGMDGSFAGTVGAAVLGIVVLFALLWSDSLAAACLLSVVTSTAAGVDVVEEWPEIDWREWLWPLLLVIQVLVLSSGPAYGLYWIVWSAGAGDLAAQLSGSALFAVTFPLLLLSVIENGSALAFYSPPVLRSAVRLPHYWLLFHLETLLPLGSLAAIAWLAIARWSFVIALAAAPILAAWVLIYARLLGRMAWHVGELAQRATDDE